MYCSGYFEGETKGDHRMELSKECAGHQLYRNNLQYTKRSHSALQGNNGQLLSGYCQFDISPPLLKSVHMHKNREWILYGE